VQRLGEQAGERIEVAAAEAGDRAEVRFLAGGQEPERDVVCQAPLDCPGGRTPVV
jgi:hypothetical protein